MIQIITIAFNTFIEVIRQPIYLIILGCSLALILLSPYFTMFAMLENNKMVKDMGLATILLSGLFLSAFSASNVIYQEVENKTILTIITKPVSRVSFIFGKYLGLLIALFIANYILTLTLVQVVRTEITEATYSQSDYPVFLGYFLSIILTLILAAFSNFFNEKSYTSSAIIFAIPIFSLAFIGLCLINNKWELKPVFQNLDFSLIVASFLVFGATSILTAIATAASTRLSPVPNIVFCCIIFLLGLFSDYIFGRHAQLSHTSSFFYSIIPNLQIYWMIDAVLENKHIPWDYVVYVLGYTFLFVLAILSFAVALFQEKET